MKRAARILVLASFFAFLAPAVSGPAPGSFFRFLVPALDDPVGAARFLREQFASLNERLAEVDRELLQQQAAYEARLGETVPRLRFYEVYSGSAVGALWARAQDPVDVIASTQLLEEVLKEDLAALAWLERVKGYLENKRDSLLRYRALLEAFQRGLEARRQLQANVWPEWSDRRDEFVIFRTNEAWDDAVRDLAVVPYFVALGGQLSPRLLGNEAILDATSATSWILSEDRLNSAIPESEFIREPRFYVRADHLYFQARAVVPLEGETASHELMVVGWLNRVARSAVQYHLEAVYVDGVPIDVYDPLLRTPMILGKFLRLDFSTHVSGSDKLGIEQHDGYLYFELCSAEQALVTVQELKSLSSCRTWQTAAGGGAASRDWS